MTNAGMGALLETMFRLRVLRTPYSTCWTVALQPRATTPARTQPKLGVAHIHSLCGWTLGQVPELAEWALRGGPEGGAKHPGHP